VQIWNLLENRYIRGVLKKFLPKISINRKIYVPMLDKPELFTLENLLKINLPSLERKSQASSSFDSEANEQGIEGSEEPKGSKKKQRCHILQSYLSEQEESEGDLTKR
jgi:hypothetical protein